MRAVASGWDVRDGFRATYRTTSPASYGARQMEHANRDADAADVGPAVASDVPESTNACVTVCTGNRLISRSDAASVAGLCSSSWFSNS